MCGCHRLGVELYGLAQIAVVEIQIKIIGFINRFGFDALFGNLGLLFGGFALSEEFEEHID